MVVFRVLEAAISVSKNTGCVTATMIALMAAMKFQRTAEPTVSHSLLINHSTNQLVRNRVSSGHLQISEVYGGAHIPYLKVTVCTSGNALVSINKVDQL